MTGKKKTQNFHSGHQTKKNQPPPPQPQPKHNKPTPTQTKQNTQKYLPVWGVEWKGAKGGDGCRLDEATSKGEGGTAKGMGRKTLGGIEDFISGFAFKRTTKVVGEGRQGPESSSPDYQSMLLAR